MGLGLCNWPNAQRVWSEQTRTLTKCALQAKFLFSNFTENLQFEEKREYVEILSNADLDVESRVVFVGGSR